jgi:hypothetical protein
MKLDISKCIIPNWFNRKQLIELVGEEVSPEQFALFKNFVEIGTADDVSEMIKTEYLYWKKEYVDVK